MAVNGVALAALAGGAVLAYSALNNKSVLTSIKDVISGKAPTPGPETYATSGAAVSSGSDIPGVSATALPSADSGSVLNETQIGSLWTLAGGSASTKGNAVCHAMQESGGRTAVTSSNPDGGVNVGLWQLDTKGVGSGHTIAQLSNALTNARITVVATKNGTDWADWATPGC